MQPAADYRPASAASTRRQAAGELRSGPADRVRAEERIRGGSGEARSGDPELAEETEG